MTNLQTTDVKRYSEIERERGNKDWCQRMDVNVVGISKREATPPPKRGVDFPLPSIPSNFGAATGGGRCVRIAVTTGSGGAIVWGA